MIKEIATGIICQDNWTGKFLVAGFEPTPPADNHSHNLKFLRFFANRCEKKLGPSFWMKTCPILNVTSWPRWTSNLRTPSQVRSDHDRLLIEAQPATEAMPSPLLKVIHTFGLSSYFFLFRMPLVEDRITEENRTGLAWQKTNFVALVSTQHQAEEILRLCRRLEDFFLTIWATLAQDTSAWKMFQHCS